MSWQSDLAQLQGDIKSAISKRNINANYFEPAPRLDRVGLTWSQQQWAVRLAKEPWLAELFEAFNRLCAKSREGDVAERKKIQALAAAEAIGDELLGYAAYGIEMIDRHQGKRWLDEVLSAVAIENGGGDYRDRHGVFNYLFIALQSAEFDPRSEFAAAAIRFPEIAWILMAYAQGELHARLDL